jgi:hypothetical protein
MKVNGDSLCSCPNATALALNRSATLHPEESLERHSSSERMHRHLGAMRCCHSRPLAGAGNESRPSRLEHGALSESPPRGGTIGPKPMGRRSRRTPRTRPPDPGGCRQERRGSERVCRPPNRPSRQPLGRSGADKCGQVPSRSRVCWRWRTSSADSRFRPTTLLRRLSSRPSSRGATSLGDQRPIGARGGRRPHRKMTPAAPRSTGAARSGARARPSPLTPRPTPRP